MADKDFLYAPNEIAMESEGFTETTLRATPISEAAIDNAMNPVKEGLKKLTLNGGKGQEGVALIGDAVLTVGESLALRIAQDVIKDAEIRTGKPLKDMSLLELNYNVSARVKDRACTENQVLAELGRLQNRAIYGDTVRRR